MKYILLIGHQIAILVNYHSVDFPQNWKTWCSFGAEIKMDFEVNRQKADLAATLEGINGSRIAKVGPREPIKFSIPVIPLSMAKCECQDV